MTLAEGPQHLLRKLERKVLKNLSREKRALRKGQPFDYFLFFFVAFSSTPGSRNLVATRSNKYRGWSRLWRAIQIRELEAPMGRTCCSGWTLGIGSISSYKHFAAAALLECGASSHRFHGRLLTEPEWNS
jgi:hypothetical protein